jgi:hypothetical protein
MQIPKHLKTALFNFLTTYLALELKSFFDRGNRNEDVSSSFLKIILVCLVIYFLLNAEDVTKVIIEKISSKRRNYSEEPELVYSSAKLIQGYKK